jgi:hypothetical protein
MSINTLHKGDDDDNNNNNNNNNTEIDMTVYCEFILASMQNKLCSGRAVNCIFEAPTDHRCTKAYHDTVIIIIPKHQESLPVNWHISPHLSKRIFSGCIWFVIPVSMHLIT